MNSSPKTLLLIDANSLIHRAFHALPPLTSKDGRPGQALYGISSVLLKLRQSDWPEYAAALFDRPEPTFRKERYPEYKATRPKVADELVEQIIKARDLFPQFGIRVFEKPGFEADDLIATLAKKFGDEPNLQVIILTGDLDTLQLVRDGHILVRVFKRGITETMTYDERAIEERYLGLRPDQLADYKALVGDTSDNVKGVEGVGPKTATALLKKFGTLDHIIENLDSEPSLKKKFSEFKEQATFSRELVILTGNADVGPLSLQDLEVRCDPETVTRYFESLGFQSLVKRLNPKEEGGKAPIEKVKKSQPQKHSNPAQGAMF